MNMNTAPQRRQTFSALSLALLIIGTANAHHKSEPTREDEQLDKFGHAMQGTLNCALSRGATAFAIPQQVQQCVGVGVTSADSTTPAPIHLAKPLSGSPYRSDKTDRYSF